MAVDISQPQIVAAFVAGAVALAVGFSTVIINAAITGWVTGQKVRADREQALSEKAWADYELRRDVYLDVATHIDALFEGSKVDA